MITSTFIGIFGIVSIMVAWTLIQQHWKRVFPEDVADDDALAGRKSCGNCGCTTQCKTKQKILKT
jgi:hypothetical protein